MATPTVTYDDLIDDLVRYGMRDEAHWRAKFPEMTPAMVREVIQVSDECPYCLKRFLMVSGVMHDFGCPVAEMEAE